jgi:threonine/homoserine efflux transporter RhtA
MVIVQALMQGLLSGAVAILLYSAAVTRLGASAGAAFVALVRALAALIAIPILGEWSSLAASIGIAATTLSVITTGACLARHFAQPAAATRPSRRS